MWLLLLACAAQVQRLGLVDVHEEQVLLVESDGRTSRLLPGESVEAFRYMDGLGVRVEGRRVGRRLFVRDWAITDAGDGSAPFVGRLRRYGSHWMLDDRGSGSSFILEEETIGALVACDGHLVMVAGVVVGAHRVRVMSWRNLEDCT